MIIIRYKSIAYLLVAKPTGTCIIQGMVRKENKLSELCGWLGMVLIHSATLPVTIKNIMGVNTALPPIEMVLLVWTGLFLFLIRAVGNNDKLYIISNAVGFFFNTILLALIVFK